MPALKKYRVFVVDDDAQIAEVCALALSGAGFEVETFCDGLAAINRAMKCEPNLVLTDFSMPKLDGIALANWLHDHCPACRVIVMSGQAAQLGKYAVSSAQLTLLQKPLTASEILASVKRALAR